jgi:hypothetical protein
MDSVATGGMSVERRDAAARRADLNRRLRAAFVEGQRRTARTDAG